MAIVLDNITYTYGMGTPFEKTALRGVSLTIENGEFLGVIGHTGSGKSTFVQHLNGLLHPTTGTVTVNGVDISASTEEAKKMRHKVGWYSSIQSINCLKQPSLKISPLVLKI